MATVEALLGVLADRPWLAVPLVILLLYWHLLLYCRRLVRTAVNILRVAAWEHFMRARGVPDDTRHGLITEAAKRDLGELPGEDPADESSKKPEDQSPSPTTSPLDEIPHQRQPGPGELTEPPNPAGRPTTQPPAA